MSSTKWTSVLPSDPAKYDTNEHRSTQRLRQILESLSSGYTTRQDHSLAKLVRPSDRSEPVQRWLKYREGYTVELCLRLFSADDFLIADPFCGFGSTLVAARMHGLRSIGMDVNPLAAYVSRVKTRTYSSYRCRQLRHEIARLRKLTKKDPKSNAPNLRILPKLFHPRILDALLVYKHAIDEINNPIVREFLLLAWIAVLEPVSNVFREGNGVKYRNRVRKGNEYTVIPYEEWQRHTFPKDKFGFVRDQILKRLEIMIEDLGQLSDGPEPAVFEADCANTELLQSRGRVSHAIFSPPYCNCFNYIKAYKLELWMAGFIESYPDIRDLTVRGIRSRVESLHKPEQNSYPETVEEFTSIMRHEDLWSHQLPDVVRGYFSDMQYALSAIYSALTDSARCTIVVGNSAYGGVLIPTDLLLAKCAESVGFSVEEIAVARPLTTSSQQKRRLAPVGDYLRESLIYLKKFE